MEVDLIERIADGNHPLEGLSSLVDVVDGYLRSVLFDSHVSCFHKQIQTLSGVSGVFSTKCCTLRDDFMWHDIVKKRDISALAKDITELIRIVGRELEFLFAQARLDF